MTTEPKELGAYVQVAGIGVSVGINNLEGLSISIFAQGSQVVAGSAYAGFTFDPRDWDILGGDPESEVFNTQGGLLVGIGTPTGTPGPAVTAMRDVVNNTYYGSVGVGVADIAEAGIYGIGNPRSPAPTIQNTDLLRSLTDAVDRANKNALEAKISGEENWQRYKHELDRALETARSMSSAGSGVKSDN